MRLKYLPQFDRSGKVCFSLCLLIIVTLSQTPVFAGLGAPLRTGVWVMQRVPRDSNELNEVATQLAANHSLSGVCLHVLWNEFETEAGKQDFTMVDKTVAVFHRVGIKYELGFGPGVHTPQFIYDEGAQAFSTIMTNPHRANYGKPIQFPIPWDPIY